MNNNKKIVFVGLYDEKNFGDPIIAHCTEWLYLREIKSDVDVVRLSLDYVEKKRSSLFYRTTRKLKKITGHDSSRNDEIIKQYKSYYLKNIKDANLIVVVGGGLIKYSCQFFYAGLSSLLDAAEKYHIPVAFNSVGIEGYDATNPKCLKLKETLQKKALCNITTRDDILTLIDGYFDGHPTVQCKKVADPAVWAKEAYEIEKKESRTVGIGIGRGGLFWDYGKNFTEEQFFSLYVNLIKRLIDNGTKLSLFTNGMLLDNIFANKIQSRLLKDGISVGLNIPNSPADLVNIIASYRCIIAARLHSCIVAYSLGIPAIGFVWNDKLKLWGENIHAEEFFVDVDNLTVDFLVDKMKKLLEYKYDSIAREQFRDTVQIDISQLAKDYFSPDFESKKLCIQGGGK